MFQATQPFSAEDIHYLIIAALEGGSSYWCEKVRILENGEKRRADCLKEEEFWKNFKPFTLRVWDAEDDQTIDCEITLEKVNAACTKLVQRPGWRGMDNHDADDGDYFFQCLTLGEVVYG